MRDFNGRIWNADQFAAAAVNSGFGWAVVQLYRDQAQNYLDACRRVGMFAGLWDAWPSAERAEYALSLGPDMYVAQAETGQAQIAMDAIGRAYDLGCRQLAIVTNLEPSRSVTGFDDYMIERGVCIHAEAYASDNPDWQHDPAGYADSIYEECVWRGYQSAFVVPSVYYGKTVADYCFEDDEAYAPYLAEDMTAAELS